MEIGAKVGCDSFCSLSVIPGDILAHELVKELQWLAVAL